MLFWLTLRGCGAQLAGDCTTRARSSGVIRHLQATIVTPGKTSCPITRQCYCHRSPYQSVKFTRKYSNRTVLRPDPVLRPFLYAPSAAYLQKFLKPWPVEEGNGQVMCFARVNPPIFSNLDLPNIEAAVVRQTKIMVGPEF